MKIKNALIIGFALLVVLLVVVFLKNLVPAADTAPQTNGNTTEEPVTATPEAEKQVTLEVFFHNVIENPELLDCTQVYPTTRTVMTNDPERRALEELISGVTDAEMEQGFVSNVNPGVDVQRLEIEDGTAYVDFSSELAEAVAGSCRVQAIEAQIRQTLLQFEHINNVVITVDGEPDALQP